MLTVFRTVFLELRPWKTVRFWSQVICADKYPSIFFREAVVYLQLSGWWLCESKVFLLNCIT